MMPRAADLILLRHAPAATGGRLCGRTDVPLLAGAGPALARTAAALTGVCRVVASPALRCRQTASALFSGLPLAQDPCLWEQDFGAEDGMALSDLPDLGPMPRAALAARCPPGGESFAQMVARVTPALERLADQAHPCPGPVVVVAHAGTVRAGLALALQDVAAGLAFEVAPLSMTRLRRHAGGWSVASVNETA